MKTYEQRVRSFERMGMTRSDAQGVVEAEDMTAKHTPGPWQQMGNCIVGKNPAQRVALVTESMKGKPLTQADACLIAAAPELLAALDAAESILSSYGLMDHAQAIRARALLARLKGDK